MKYKVQITEQTTYEAEVEATNEQEALDVFYDKHYGNEKITYGETIEQNIELLTN